LVVVPLVVVSLVVVPLLVTTTGAGVTTTGATGAPGAHGLDGSTTGTGFTAGPFTSFTGAVFGWSNLSEDASMTLVPWENIIAIEFCSCCGVPASISIVAPTAKPAGLVTEITFVPAKAGALNTSSYRTGAPGITGAAVGVVGVTVVVVGSGSGLVRCVTVQTPIASNFALAANLSAVSVVSAEAFKV